MTSKNTHIRRKVRHSKGRVLPPAVMLVVVAALLLASHTPDALGADDIEFPVKGTYDAHSSFYQAGINAADINADGKKELLIGNQNGYLYCFKHNARLLWRYYAGGAIQGTPACSDVNHDGKMEIWVGDMEGFMHGIDCNGKPLSKWGWPKKTHQVGGLSGIFSSPAIGDINGDGAEEIVVGNWGQRLYAWTYYGEMLPGWPINNEDTIWSSPALADLDWDGVKEVIVGADSTGGVNWPYPPGGLLWAFDEDASVLPGFPRVTPEVTWSSPAVADIDRDGRYEIIVGTGHYYSSIDKLTTQSHRVYAYNHDGTDVSGWPVGTAGATFSSPALGDINGDSVREIVIGTIPVNGVGSNHVTAFSPRGNVILDVSADLGGPNMGSPAIGDVDGNGIPDVTLGSGQYVYAWDHAGNVLRKRNMHNFVVGSPAVGDFDRDGKVEVAVATGDQPGGTYKGGAFYVFDCGPKKSVAGGDSQLFPWPMFRRTANHHATVLTGKEPPPPPPSSYQKWYLAEGSTGPGMETWVLVQNPNDSRTTVRLIYMTDDGAVAGPVLKLPPHSRHTFNAADTVPNKWEVSTLVYSEKEIIVERAMYGNNRTWAHNSIGATAAKRTWYLPEGSTGPEMETWVLVQNPNRTAATVHLTCNTGSGPEAGPQAVIPANSRRTFNLADSVPNNWSVSTQVRSDKPVVAERAMYGKSRTWAHDSIGATLPATKWYLAEGSTAFGMETWILVQNPTYPATNVQIDYMTPKGKVSGPSLRIPSSARRTIFVADTVNNAAGVSTVVSSDNPIICERAMYGNDRAWAHDSIGAVSRKKTWYLAEGSTGGGMETWILVQNPGSTPASVSLTYMTPGGPREGPSMVIPANSRYTFSVADTVPNTWEVSTMVYSNKAVIVERAMYGNDRTWAHESIGFGK
jgi:hypothetical protein